MQRLAEEMTLAQDTEEGKMFKELTGMSPEGIPFPQIYESKPMTTYGVLAIPYTILFAPDGTILFRGPLPTAEKRLAKFFGDDNAEK